MSLIVKLQNNGVEVPLEVFPNEDFATVLQKASTLVGYEIDISSLTGEDQVSFTDNVYEYFMRDESLFTMQTDDDAENMEGMQEVPEYKYQISDALNSEDVAGVGDIQENIIKIIELADNFPVENAIASGIKLEQPFTDEDVFNIINESASNERIDTYNYKDIDEVFSDDEEVDHSKLIEPKVRNRITCSICCMRLSNMKDPERNYIFDEKNHSVFKRHILRNRLLTSNLVCTKCLNKKFVRERKGTKNILDENEFIVIRDKTKMIFKKIIEDVKPKSKKKMAKTFTKDLGVTFEDILNLVKHRQMAKNLKSGSADANTNFVVRRKICKETPKVIKRKLEMDGTISEVTDFPDDNIKSEEKRMRLTNTATEALCRMCGLVLNDLLEVVNHGLEHQMDHDGDGIPCIICSRTFKTLSELRKHVIGEHDTNADDDEHAVYIKSENTNILTKKEEMGEEGDEEDLTDRLHKYLSGELDADTFFQQEYLQTDERGQVLLDNDDYDDDDVIVCIVEAEKPNEDEEEVHDFNLADEDMQNDVDDMENVNIAGDEAGDLMECDDNMQSAQGSGEIQHYHEAGHGEELTENIVVAHDVETFEEIDYFEDPEYEPDDKDNDSVKSFGDDKKKRKWISQGKIKCEVCNKCYTTMSRFDQHKCYPTTAAIDDKKEETTCSICKETFLSKVRLQFHKQTHKEGGWQLMGCDQCNRKDFTSEHELFDHIYYSHSKPIICPFDGCEKTFKLKKLLKTHMRDHGMKKFECEVCGQRFQVHQTLKEHMVLHLKVKPYQCHICQKYMSKASRLRMHLLVHTSEQRPAYVLVCRYCDCAFKDAVEAEAHCDNPHDCEPREEDKDGLFNEIFDDMDVYSMEELRSNWRKNSKFSKNEEGNNDEQNMEESLINKHNLLMQLSDVARSSTSAVWIDKVYSCQYCEKVYYTKEALHHHRYVHSGVSQPYQCHLCEARFLTYARCTAHKSTHGYFKEGGAPSLRDFPVIKHYLCDLCDKSNLLWTTVSVHYRHHHKYGTNKMTPPPCSTCYQQYSTSWELGKHRRIKHRKDVHEGSKAPNKVVNFSYKCLECDQQLPNKSALTNHRKVAHENNDEGGKNIIKPKYGLLVCSECGKTYATKPALLTHIKWHTEHGIGAEAAKRRKRAFGKGSHICSSCGLGFYSAANLRAHIDRIHEKTFKYTCEECGKGHFTYMEMETHKLTHTGERPYKCPACPRAYVTKAILNKHYRNHTGERPYTCDVCDATFKTAHSRNYHRAKHTNGKLPSPFIVLEVKGGDPKSLQAALQASIQAMAVGKDKDDKERVLKHMSDDDYNIKEEMEDFHQDVNDEVLVQTSEDVEIDNIPMHDESSGIQIVYKKVSVNEGGCEDEYTIEYEEQPH